MRVVLLTDCLGAGGAQRQLVLLARAMHLRGHEVVVLTYRSGDFFGKELDAHRIKRSRLQCGGRLDTLRTLREELVRLRPDAIVAFLENPAFYAELASLGQKWRLVVSERNNDPAFEASTFTKARRLLHLLADVVTTNSHTNRAAIESANPFLKGRVRTIYNGVDLTHFRPIDREPIRDGTRLVVFASHKPEKNFGGLALALALFRRRSRGLSLTVDWYGDDGSPGGLTRDRAICGESGVDDLVRFFPPIESAKVVIEMHRADAVLLPSLWEGLPNTVCEAMAAGRPVLISDVCDANYLVEDGRTGLLFDPRSPESIAEALERFARMDVSARRAMGVAARVRAESMLSLDVFASAYESAIAGAMV